MNLVKPPTIPGGVTKKKPRVGGGTQAASEKKTFKKRFKGKSSGKSV